MIPVCVPALLGNEKKYILDAIETNWISSAGKYIPAFEEKFAEFCNVKHGIAVTNGTNAIHLALTALGIGKGDEVIIPDFTMISSAFAVCYTGAMPVFIDADKETWNINPEKIEEKITNKTKAIMVVHIYGLPYDMDRIWEIAKKNNLKIIEDAAEVHGAEYKGRKCGNLGDVACFSFYGNKIITTGEGGMVVTNDDKIAEKCKYYKNLCFDLNGKRNYLHKDIGFNYRMSNLHAAIGLAQVEMADKYIEMRIKNNSLYRKFLQGIKGINFQPEKPEIKNVYWMNGIVINPKEIGITRDELMEKLKQKGIDCRMFFKGMHKQPSLEKYGCNVLGDYPVSDWLSENGLYLPSGSGLKQEEIEKVCNAIKEIIGK
jgi:perosamine synthetase